MNKWDQPATKYLPKRLFTRSVALTANWRDINWAALNTLCLAEQSTAVDTYMQEREAKYENWIKEKEREYSDLHPESGSYEGNLRDENPIGMPNFETLFRIKRISSNTAIEAFVLDCRIKESAIYILPQIIQHIGEFKLTAMSGEPYLKMEADKSLREGSVSGLISAGKLFRAYFEKDEHMMGLYNFLMLDSRSCYLETQYKAPQRNFCALVPLIMYAFKLKGVPYSHWAKEQLQAIVNVKLLDAMLYKFSMPDKETILAARTQGLMTKTGPKMGQIRNPLYTFKLFGKTELSNFPEYVQVMLTQIWCAHPENRHKYMILDPHNWDVIPLSLVDSEVISAIPLKNTSGVPWD